MIYTGQPHLYSTPQLVSISLVISDRPESTAFINGQASDWLSERSGVPQGSVLEPLYCLAILYIDALHHSVIDSTLKFLLMM